MGNFYLLSKSIKMRTHANVFENILLWDVNKIIVQPKPESIDRAIDNWEQYGEHSSTTAKQQTFGSDCALCCCCLFFGFFYLAHLLRQQQQAQQRSQQQQLYLKYYNTFSKVAFVFVSLATVGAELCLLVNAAAAITRKSWRFSS